MQWTIELSTGPTTEPVTPDEVKDRLRIDTAADSADLDLMIQASREYAEGVTKRQIVSATWKLYLDDFWGAARILIPRPPLSSVTSIAYLDTNGDSQTFASSKYVVNAIATPGYIHLAHGKSWPAVRDGQYNGVTITYVAGYSSIPQRLKDGIIAEIRREYDDPDDKALSQTVHRLLGPYVIPFESPWWFS